MIPFLFITCNICSKMIAILMTFKICFWKTTFQCWNDSISRCRCSICFAARARVALILKEVEQPEVWKIWKEISPNPHKGPKRCGHALNNDNRSVLPRSSSAGKRLDDVRMIGSLHVPELLLHHFLCLRVWDVKMFAELQPVYPSVNVRKGQTRSHISHLPQHLSYHLQGHLHPLPSLMKPPGM